LGGERQNPPPDVQQKAKLHQKDFDPSAKAAAEGIALGWGGRLLQKLNEGLRRGGPEPSPKVGLTTASA